VVHWTQKYDQEVHADYRIHCYDERYKIIQPSINYYFWSMHGLSAPWCPMSSHFFTRWVSRLLGWLWYQQGW